MAPICVLTARQVVLHFILTYIDLAAPRQKYPTKDFGIVKHFLEWSIRRDIKSMALYLFQPYLAQKLVDMVGLRGGRPTPSAYIYGLDLGQAKPGEQILDVSKFPIAQAVGTL